MKQIFTSLLKVHLCFWIFLATTTSYSQDNQPQTSLTPSPRQSFTPTPQATRGYWNIDVVGDFTLPKTKSITFCGAGRNLHASQDWQKLFRRGFSSIERSRMTTDEIGLDRRERISSDIKSNKADTWKSRLLPEQRALILYQNYFTEPPFSLSWARDSEFARTTYFQQPPGSATPRQSLGTAMSELSGGCVAFNDCPFTGQINTFGKIYFDIENEGTSPANEQEHANLYVYKMWAIRKVISNYTEIGGIGPVPRNNYGNSRSTDYLNLNSTDWLWSTKARQIEATNTRGRGMPDDIVGKSFGELADFQMPHSYFLSSDLDYSASHNGDGDRHWLASLLGEQEVNMKLSPKKRIAWQWLFNTQSTESHQASRAEFPAPPAIAEGMGIFYWFTGAYGTIFWDDWNELTPNAPAVPGRENLDNNRNYACYEHYIHGLWRLFKHHGELFNGQEQYLNEQTECSYDGGKSWYRLNANALKRSGFPFARVIVNGDQILIAATQAYASPNQQSSLMVRYVQDGYRFYTTINLKGDEIFLGRGTMPKGSSAVIPSQTTLPVVNPDGGTSSPLAATVASYNCSTGAIVFGTTSTNSGAVEFQTPGITGWTTNRLHTIEAGLRADPKPVTIQIRQNGVNGSAFLFDFVAFCSGNQQPSTNTAPTVANAMSAQSAVINAQYSLNIGNVFTDAQTPNELTLTTEGLPAGLRLNGTVISGTPTALGVNTVTLRATDPSGLSTTASFELMVRNSAPVGGVLSATVVSYNCTTGAITFGSTGGNGSTVEYSAIGVTGWTTNQNFTLETGLRLDLKPITINVRQNGIQGSSYIFDLKAYCTSNPQPPVNTAPTVANAVSPQSAVVGTAYSLNIGSVFTDSQTPTALTLTVVGLPAGLTLNGTVITGTPSVSGVSTVTLRATDPGSLSGSVSFVLTVTDTPVTPPVTGVLSATVVSYNCTTGAIVFGSIGGNNSPVEYSSIGITGWTTNPSVIIGAGLRSDPKPVTIQVRQAGVEGRSYTFDLKAYCTNPPSPPVNTAPVVANAVGPQSSTVGTAYSLNIGSVFTDSQTPTALTLSAVGLPAGLSLTGTVITGTPSVSGVSTITLSATDPGSLSSSVSFVLTVNLPTVTTPPPPPNTAPTVVIGVSPQSATVGTAFNLNVGGIFTDAQTPNDLRLTVIGLPAGLSLTGTSITGTPSVSGTSNITLRAIDPGNLSSSVFFLLTVSPQQITTPPSSTTSTPSNTTTTIECGSFLNSIGQPLRVLGVDNINCSNGSFRVVTEGGNGSAINYANLVGLSNADPNNCRRFLDNPDMVRAVNNPFSDIGNFQIRVTQNGVTSNSITFNFKQYCTRSASRVAHEVQDDLTVLVLGNPVMADWVEVDVNAARNEPVTFRITDVQGKMITQHEVGPSGEVVRQRLWLGQAGGVLLLQVNTPTRSKLIKLVRY